MVIFRKLKREILNKNKNEWWFGNYFFVLSVNTPLACQGNENCVKIKCKHKHRRKRYIDSERYKSKLKN